MITAKTVKNSVKLCGAGVASAGGLAGGVTTCWLKVTGMGIIEQTLLAWGIISLPVAPIVFGSIAGAMFAGGIYAIGTKMAKTTGEINTIRAYEGFEDGPQE